MNIVRRFLEAVRSFEAKVVEIAVGQRLLLKLGDNGLEVSERTDRRKRRKIRGADETAQRAQQQGRFDEWQRDCLLMHRMGLDHTRLTYRFQGRDFRLMDVEGEVVKKLLA